MECALCLENKKLRKSHIIPEFLYKPIYEEDPKRYFGVSTDSSEGIDHRQQGIWDRLLCGDCEQHLSKWEDYASTLLYQRAQVQEISIGLRVVNVDYEKFKLFLLSLLWRAGATSRKEFSEVSLGPHEEKLRKMLLENEPGPTEKYGCMPVLCPKYKDVLQNMIISPDTVKVRAHHVVRFLLGGLFWNFFVSSHTPSIASEGIFLTEDGELTILAESEFTSEYIEQLYRRWKDSGNLDDVIDKFGGDDAA